MDQKADETGTPVVSLSEAAAKIDPSALAAFLEKELDEGWGNSKDQIRRFYYYLETEFSQVSFPWKIFKECSISTLIDVPLSHIPTCVDEPLVDFLNRLPIMTILDFQTWALDETLNDWAAEQGGTCYESKSKVVPRVVALAMILRCKPDTMISLMPNLRGTSMYQGQDKLPVIIWMMAQASQGDLSIGLYLWAYILLPLMGDKKKCCTPHSMDLILQFVEIILSNPKARTILVEGHLRGGHLVIYPYSFETLVRLTFPASSARVKETKRFEAVYPLLKEVALAYIGRNAVLEHIFNFSLKFAGEKGNPGLAKEAAAIAIRCVTENVDGFKHWDILYKEKHLEASVALLRKLVDEWEIHSPKLLSSSPSDILTVNRTMNSFRQKNERAITQGGANCSLYQEADKSCKLILRRLSPGSGSLEMTRITAVFLATAIAAAGGIAGAALRSLKLSSKKNCII